MDLELQTPKKEPRTPSAQKSSKGTGNEDWIRDSRSFLERHMSYAAPTAIMTETPSRSARMDGDPSSSRAKGKGKARVVDPPSPPSLRSKPRDTVDFQVDADRAEMARDLADPDFGGPSSLTRKRRAVAPADPSPSAKRAKQQRHRHIAYENCQADARKDRDKHLARIQENWNAPREEWMSESMMPSKKIKQGKHKGRRQPLDTKDWNSRLLAELSYLSGVTKDKPTEAYKALQEAVSRKDRFGGGPQLLESDVQYAIRACENTKPTVPMAATIDPVTGDADEISADDILNDATADVDIEAGLQFPSPRSPTFVGDDHIVKQEPQPQAANKVREAACDVAWDGYDDEMDKLEELKLIEEQKLAVVELKAAQYARSVQRRRVRELARRHGKTKDDAILLRPEEDV